MWLVGFLLCVLTFVSGWSKVESANTRAELTLLKESMPKDYVLQDHYAKDRVERNEQLKVLTEQLAGIHGRITHVDDKIADIYRLMITRKEQ